MADLERLSRNLKARGFNLRGSVTGLRARARELGIELADHLLEEA